MIIDFCGNSLLLFFLFIKHFKSNRIKLNVEFLKDRDGKNDKKGNFI